MVWYNLFSWGKKLQIKELYCQNPDCRNPLIKRGSQVALCDEIDNKLSVTHAHKACYLTYGDSYVLKHGRVFSGIFEFVEYDEAVKLAEQGKLKFSHLELTAQR